MRLWETLFDFDVTDKIEEHADITLLLRIVPVGYQEKPEFTWLANAPLYTNHQSKIQNLGKLLIRELDGGNAKPFFIWTRDHRSVFPLDISSGPSNTLI